MRCLQLTADRLQKRPSLILQLLCRSHMTHTDEREHLLTWIVRVAGVPPFGCGRRKRNRCRSPKQGQLRERRQHEQVPGQLLQRGRGRNRPVIARLAGLPPQNNKKQTQKNNTCGRGVGRHATTTQQQSGSPRRGSGWKRKQNTGRTTRLTRRKLQP